MRLLVVNPNMAHGGGGTVAAWALQALSESDHQVTVLTWQPQDLETINQLFGTNLDASAFRWVYGPPAIRWVMASLPFSLSFFEINLLIRRARSLWRTRQYDLVFGTLNEIDVGDRAIQYVHFPWAIYPRPEADLRWYHLKPFVLAFRALCALISGCSKSSIGRNETLANSEWTKRNFEAWYGAPAKVVYPPVPGDFPEVRPEERALAFACLGRIAPEKELEKIIEILARVRARGHDLRLRIVGQTIEVGYVRQLREFARPHSSWVEFHANLPRQEMVRVIASSRYGIHGMVGEHFGIAPAELQRAGCITFVADDGGPLEIVGGDHRVVYRSIDDAVEKIHQVLSDPDLEQAIRNDLKQRAEHFTT